MFEDRVKFIRMWCLCPDEAFHGDKMNEGGSSFKTKGAMYDDTALPSPTTQHMPTHFATMK